MLLMIRRRRKRRRHLYIYANGENKYSITQELNVELIVHRLRLTWLITFNPKTFKKVWDRGHFHHGVLLSKNLGTEDANYLGYLLIYLFM